MIRLHGAINCFLCHSRTGIPQQQRQGAAERDWHLSLALRDQVSGSLGGSTMKPTRAISVWQIPWASAQLLCRLGPPLFQKVSTWKAPSNAFPATSYTWRQREWTQLCYRARAAFPRTPPVPGKSPGEFGKHLPISFCYLFVSNLVTHLN